MKITTSLWLFAAMILYSTISFSQNIVSVNKATGSGDISIPLLNVTSGSLSLPISLNYRGNGIKVKDREGSAGMNWNLMAGGQVTRQLKGLPDDCQYNMINEPMKGWLYNPNVSAISSFTTSNTATTPNCTYGTTDLSTITTYFANLYDTEPDIYNVSAPGLSCSFVFDASGKPKLTSYQDLKIDTTLSASGEITSFKITNDKGVAYLFASVEATTKFITAPNNGNDLMYFKNDYNRYKGGIYYVSAWRLTSVTDMNSNRIDFNYHTLPQQGYSVPLKLFTNRLSGDPVTQYTSTGVNLRLALKSISTANDDDLMNPTVSLGNVTSDAREQIDTIFAYGQKIAFGYRNIQYNAAYNRSFLNSVTIGAKTYTFTYNRLTTTPNGHSTALPDSTSRSIDMWGYYNGTGNPAVLPKVYINTSNSSLPRYRHLSPGSSTTYQHYGTFQYGDVRNANTTEVTLGMLDTIKYSDGGFTKLTYESNQFYDPVSATAINGGGVRIKTILNYDGVNAANNMVKNYTYVDPSNGRSSGRPVALPVYVFTNPYDIGGDTNTNWIQSTMASEIDLSPEDKTIYYSHVKESQTGAGSTLYEFSVPATLFDNTASPVDATVAADWAPTLISTIKRNCIGAASTLMINDKNTYPFPANINYDYERGLLKKMTNYNDANAVVNESVYTYQRTGTPTVVSGFIFDDNGTYRSYAKYSIYTGVGELTKTVTNKVYDLPYTGSPSTSLFKQTVSTVNYASTLHKLPTSTEVTNSDGSISRSFTKYAKEYTATSGSDTANAALYYMQARNFNGPVEKYMQLERGGVNKTYSGQLVKYKLFPNLSYGSRVAPHKVLSFVSKEGLTNGGGGFVPSSVTSGVFTNYSGYLNTKTNLIVDHTGEVISSVDDSHRASTAFSNYKTGQVVATVSNAKANEVAFIDFDNPMEDWQFIQTTGAGGGIQNNYPRSGANSYLFNSGTTFGKTIQKNTIARNYIFSAWINTAYGGTITITLSNGTVQNFSLPYTNTGGAWKYHEIKIPLTSFAGMSSFNVSFSASSSVAIDDVFFYPDISHVSQAAYEPISRLKTSETSGAGVARHFSYDGVGRLIRVRDQDNNILQKISHADRAGILSFVTPVIATDNESPNYNTPVYFSNNRHPFGIISDEFKYTWNFGDGSTATSTNYYGLIAHTYTAAGTYTVTLTMSSPIYGTKTATKTVTVTSGSSSLVQIGGVDSPLPGGTITGLDVYIGSTLYTSFTAAQVTGGTAYVPQGVYNFRLKVTGSVFNPSTYVGFRRVAANVNYIYHSCVPATTGSNVVYYFSFDLNGKTTVGFEIDVNNECEGVID